MMELWTDLMVHLVRRSQFREEEEGEEEDDEEEAMLFRNLSTVYVHVSFRRSPRAS